MENGRDGALKISTKQFVTLPSGAEFTVQSGEDGRPVDVVLAGDEGAVVLPAQFIEQVAEFLQHSRVMVGDMRYVCAAHGYFDNRAHECPVCVSLRPAVPTPITDKPTLSAVVSK